jgi:ArsR family transcriptional regulator
MITPAQVFKCLSDETRLRCVSLVQKRGQLCVCELTSALALSQPKISRHLKQLRQYGLLLDSREGQWVYYRINPQLPDWVLPILQDALNAVEAIGSMAGDLERLQVIGNNSQAAACCLCAFR